MVLEVRGATSRSGPRQAAAQLSRLVDHLDRPAQPDQPLLWVTTEDGVPTLWVEVAWWDGAHSIRRAVRTSVPIEGLSPDQLEGAIAAAVARLRGCEPGLAP
ncbi:MAG TPA: hypothetical protein VKY90_10675 [Candidatus Dormibacteraeota bacterium]|nr:hypothetical protein [Candidatus Dormibacteraeota bacterium]